MKTHLKALGITVLVFLVMVGLYKLFISKPPPTETKPVFSASKLTLPEAALKTIDGKSIDLKEFAGKPIIFNFWASWCSPCIEEVPSLVSLVKADPNIVIIAVSGDTDEKDIRAFLKSFPNFNKPPIYIVQAGAQELTNRFQVDRLPESFIFNAKGEMVKKVTGTINWHTPDSVEYFKSLR